MKNIFVFLFCLIGATVAGADGEGLSNAGTRPGYTGEAPAKASSEMPEELKDVGISEKIGEKIDLNLIVTDETGTKLPLSSFFKTHKPVVLSPVYFSCPGLCNFHLNGLTDTLKNVDWSPAKEFEIIAFSFDAKEKSEVAKQKKESYLKVYGRENTAHGWHFVTADQQTINTLTQSVGFKFKWNEKAGEWSHASAAIVISPEGKISRYLHGIVFEPRDVKLALNEAADGKVGGIVDSVMLYCFKYDNHQSKYGLQIFNLMKIAGALTVIALAIWLTPVIIQAKREKT